MTEINAQDKTPMGGVCFRMDDNQTPKKWFEIAEVFNRHKVKLCASLNIGFMNKAHYEMLKQLQKEGHEVMDHSPLHDPTKFHFAPGKNADDYKGLPGVDHIKGKTVYLKYQQPKVEDQKGKPLKAKIEKDKLVLLEKPDKNFAKKLCRATAAFIPDGQKVYKIKQQKGSDVFNLRDVWGEANVNETSAEVQVYFLDTNTFSMTPEAIELLGRNSLDTFSAIGAERPVSWIQPGGVISCISSEQAKKILGDRLGYKSAATYISKAKKVFREYNPEGACAFGMMWSDFDEEGRGLQWNKSRIAELTALHHVAFGHSHMRPKDSWKKYLQRLDKLLAWCAENNIPVRTQKEWAEILYNPEKRKSSRSINVFPSLKIDRDNNDCPDGYKLRKGSWEREKHEITSQKRGEIFAVKSLAGLEKGNNKLSFVAKADADCKLTLVIDFPEIKRSRKQKTFSLRGGKINDCVWNITVPEEASTGNFSWHLLNDNRCGISRILLKKEDKK